MESEPPPVTAHPFEGLLSFIEDGFRIRPERFKNSEHLQSALEVLAVLIALTFFSTSPRKSHG